MTAEGAQVRRREEQVRRLLAEHAGTVIPGDGMAVIRARIAVRRPWWRQALDRLTRTNGAPVAAGTPPIPTAEKEPTMSHDLISEGTPRGRQMAAALALAKMLESGPDELVRWSVDDLGRLHGHVRRPASDAQARAAMEAFGEFLAVKVERSQGRNEHAEWVRLCVTGIYRQTPVNVWTRVAIRPVSPYASFGGAA